MKINFGNRKLLVALAVAISAPILAGPAIAELIAQPPLTLSPSSSKIYVGQTTATSLSGGAGSGEVVYSTSTPTVCSISITGKVTALKLGSCLISAVKAGDLTYMELKATSVVTVQPVTGKVQLKKYKTYFTISIQLPSELYYGAATVQIGTQPTKKSNIAYKTAEVMVLDDKGYALYYSDGPAQKGTYYRVMVGNEIIKAQKIL